VLKAFIGHGPHQTEQSTAWAELRFGNPSQRPFGHLDWVATIVCQHDCAVLKRSGLSKIAQIVQ
jgi:hypothetical protein